MQSPITSSLRLSRIANPLIIRLGIINPDQRGRSGYSASKFAMNGFLDVLREENLKTGIHIMTACPGFTASNIRNVALAKDRSQQGESSLDEDKMMTAAEVAKIIANGVENRSRTLIMTRQGKLLVFLNKFFPAWLDKLVYNNFTKEKDALLKYAPSLILIKSKSKLYIKP